MRSSSKKSSRRQSGGSKHSSKKHSVSKKSKSMKKSKSSSKGKSMKGKLAANQCMCMRCKKAVVPNGSKKITLANNRCRLVGTCPHCGTNVGKFCKCD